MIDLFDLNIPFFETDTQTKEKIISYIEDRDGRTVGGELQATSLIKYGVNVRSGKVTQNSNGDLIIEKLHTSYESLESSFSQLAFKFHLGNHMCIPHLKLRASPAKLLQGHNVYGSDNPKVCAYYLIESFIALMPEVGHLLDIKNTTIQQIDITYSAKVKNDFLARQVIKSFSNVDTKHIKATHVFDTSVMFNAGSKKCVREIYLKEHELNREIKSIEKNIEKNNRLSICSDFLEKRLNILKSELVQNFAKNNVRFEAKIKSNYLIRRGITTSLFKFFNLPPETINKLWHDAFYHIFKATEGENVNIHDDNKVYDKLKSKLAYQNKNGNLSYTHADKAFELYLLIKNTGFYTAKKLKKESTFYRILADLKEVVPLNILQSCNKVQNNIIPICNVINIDFAKQLPNGFIEPQINMLKAV